MYECATAVILCCLHGNQLDRALLVHRLFRDASLPLDICDDVKRALLIALCSVGNMDVAREVYAQLKDTVVFCKQSLDPPR